MNTHAINGAYASLDDLLRLRYRRLRFKSSKRKETAHNSGTRLSRMRGRGVDFSEVRLYQPGDDVRNIDWRVTARKAKPHTKIFTEERERPVFLVTDQSQNMFFGSKHRLKSVVAAELTGLLAWQALHKGDRVGGMILANDQTYPLKPYRSTRTVVRLLTRLAKCNQALNRNAPAQWLSIDAALLQLVKLAHTGHRIYIISDFTSALDNWRRNLHQLARHNDVVLVLVSDPLEHDLPPADLYAITNGEQRLQLSTSGEGIRERYHARFMQRQERVSRLAVQAGATFLPLSTADDTENTLRSKVRYF